MVTSLLAAVAVFSGVIFFAAWVAAGAASPSEARVRALALGRRPAPASDVPFRERVLLPIASGISRGFAAILPHTFIVRTDRRLTEAGNPMRVETFYAFVAVLGAFLPAMLFFLIVSSGAPAITLFLVPAAAFVGIALPILWLSRKARQRRTAIWKSLPGAFDLITTCVEAGLGLDAAFQRVAEKSDGAFAAEIRQMLSEVEMGRPRREALEAMAHRVGVPNVLTFVHAVTQAQQLGTNLGKVLRAQAYQMRVQRRQRAEETARRMPIKMVFPLVFCMIPSLFIVTIGPVALTLIRELSD